MVDLVYSKNSKYLRMRIHFLLTKSIFGLIYNWRRREDNSLMIYTLFQCFREVFFLHFMNGEFLTLMNKEEYAILLPLRMIFLP